MATSTLPSLSSPSSPSKAASEAYLTSLLNKSLRVTTADTRLFLGEFKCTDAENNIILSRTYEYRLPTPPSLSSTPAATPSLSPPSAKTPSNSTPTANATNSTLTPAPTPKKTISKPMSSRYLGLVVIPGPHITKIEVEEFASQIGKAGAGAGSRWAAGPEVVGSAP